MHSKQYLAIRQYILKNTYKDLKLGSYTLLANSLHLYERHFDMGKNISFYIQNKSDAHIDNEMNSYTREEAIEVLQTDKEIDEEYIRRLNYNEPYRRRKCKKL